MSNIFEPYSTLLNNKSIYKTVLSVYRELVEEIEFKDSAIQLESEENIIFPHFYVPSVDNPDYSGYDETGIAFRIFTVEQEKALYEEYGPTLKNVIKDMTVHMYPDICDATNIENEDLTQIGNEIENYKFKYMKKTEDILMFYCNILNKHLMHNIKEFLSLLWECYLLLIVEKSRIRMNDYASENPVVPNADGSYVINDPEGRNTAFYYPYGLY